MKMLKYTVIILFVVSAFGFVGCKVPEESIGIEVFSLNDKDSVDGGQAQNEMADRFTDPGKSSDGDSVAMWAKRYDSLSEKADELSADNRKYSVENSELKYKIAELEGELETTKSELDDAVKFLGDMQVELVNWKRDVLGYRKEIKSAHDAQIRALTKIVKLLGGETADVEESEAVEEQKDD